MAGLKLLGWSLPETLRSKHSSPWWLPAEAFDPILHSQASNLEELRRDGSLSCSLCKTTVVLTQSKVHTLECRLRNVDVKGTAGKIHSGIDRLE